MRRLLVLASVLACSSAVAQTSLEETVTATVATNPKINQVLSQYRANEMAVDGAKGEYLPSIDIFAGAGQEKVDREGDNDGAWRTRKELGISLQQLIFDGFRTSYNIDRTEYEAKAEQFALFAEAEDVSLMAVKAHADVVKAQTVYQLAQENLEVHKRIYGDIKRRSDSGIGTSSDLSQIDARLARAQADEVVARNNLEDARAVYIRIVDKFPEDLAAPSAPTEGIPADFSEVLAIATRENPRISVAHNDIYAADAQYQSAKGAYYPQLTFNAEHGLYMDADGIDGEKTETRAMVRLNYNVFRGGSDKAYEEQTAFLKEKAQYISEQTYREVTEGARLSWNATKYLQQQLDFLNQHVAASQKTRDAYRQQFLLGKRTLLDVLNTESELYQAKTEQVAAQMDLVVANYRILNAMGHLLASVAVPYPEDWNQVSR